MFAKDEEGVHCLAVWGEMETCRRLWRWFRPNSEFFP